MLVRASALQQALALHVAGGTASFAPLARAQALLKIATHPELMGTSLLPEPLVLGVHSALPESWEDLAMHVSASSKLVVFLRMMPTHAN